jgi:acyl-CoA synthetase (AMP-forming)/AMP-acid ligase II
MPISGAPLGEPIRVRTLLQPGLDQHPDEAAIVSAESTWTWRELDRASDRLAANLLALGLKPGDRVASLMPNRGALVVHYLACLKAGLVATPLNYRYMPPEIDHALEVSGAKLIFAHAERAKDLKASKKASHLPLGIVHFDVPVDQRPNFDDLVAREPATPVQSKPDLSDPAIIFFTSGSTGRPKGVTHSFQTLGCMLTSIIQGFEYKNSDIVLAGSSLSHIAGVVFSLAALAVGARVVIPRTMDGDEVLPLLRAHRPTILWMLPAALFALVRDHGATRDDFRSLRYCFSGGDKIAAELEREFTALTGFPIDENYGMTEIGGATINPPSGVIKMGSVGRLSNGYTASIRDEHEKEVPVGTEGRLWIKSPCNMVGYWNNPEATKETIREGWLDTGDMMRADADGYLWFCGRKKQIIIHDGSNICPQEIEEALLEHPSVESAGVVGIHDLVHGENVRAYIVLKPNAKSLTSQELIQFARQRVGYKAPEEIVFLSEMPLNATGKVDRVALKRLAEAGSARLSK